MFGCFPPDASSSCWEHTRVPADCSFSETVLGRGSVLLNNIYCVVLIVHHLSERLEFRVALITGDVDEVVKVPWFLTLEIVMEAAV